MYKNCLSEEQQALLLAICESAKEVVVVGHKSPDGDSLGSSLAIAHVLKSVYNIPTTVVAPDNYPDNLRWLPDAQTIINYERHPEIVAEAVSKADYIFCVDLNDLSRTGPMAPLLMASEAKKVMFDHHTNPVMEAVVSVSEPTLCSTCELIFYVVNQLGLLSAMPTKWATMVYCGMMTDTGAFTYNSSRPEIFSVVSALLDKGVNKDKIYRLVYHAYSSWAIRFRGYVMAQKLNVFEDLHAAYFAISQEEMDDYHYLKGDAEGLVNVPLTIKDLRLSISLREDDHQKNSVWVSIRTVGNVPAHTIAETFFNGGGHENAAGGHLDCSLDDACNVAKQAIKAAEKYLV